MTKPRATSWIIAGSLGTAAIAGVWIAASAAPVPTGARPAIVVPAKTGSSVTSRPPSTLAAPTVPPASPTPVATPTAKASVKATVKPTVKKPVPVQPSSPVSPPSADS